MQTAVGLSLLTERAGSGGGAAEEATCVAIDRCSVRIITGGEAVDLRSDVTVVQQIS